MARELEQGIGALVVAFVLADVYLTVLYARIGAGGMRTIGTGVISSWLSRGTWALFRGIARSFPKAHGTLLSFAGPTIVVLLLSAWALVLSGAVALIVHPALDDGISNSAGSTPTDFITALYVAGTSLAFTGSSTFEPTRPGYELLYLVNAVIGTFLVSMAVTYVLQVYSALRRRNTLALNVDLLSGETGDAVELLAGLGPQGRFETGYNDVTQLADQIASAKESLHVYPVMFYFRYPDALYSIARFTLVALDTVALLKCALDDERYGWFKESAAVIQMSAATLVLQTTIEEAFLAPVSKQPGEGAVDDTHARWIRRFETALDRLKQAGIATVQNERAAADRYVALREQWDERTVRIGRYLGYAHDQIDVAGCNPEEARRRKLFSHRRHAMM